MPAANGDILGRFWSKVDIGNPNDCWRWSNHVDTYGRFRILPGFRAIGAHRFSWILANKQDIPEGLVVMHSCDNRACVNPSHLSLGTVSDNAIDALLKGRLDMQKAWVGAQRYRQGVA